MSGSRRSPGVGNGNPVQYSCLEHFMDKGAWWTTACCHKESDMPAHSAPSSCNLDNGKRQKESEGQLPGAGERHSTRDKGHEEGGSAYAKAGWSLGSPPGYSRASTPKNQSLPTLLLCALTSDFTGGCPLPPSRSLCQRVNLQLQLIKFLGN